MLTIPRPGAGRVIPDGFLGLGFEYRALMADAGEDPNAVDPVLEQLIRNLTPGRAPALRIGGDSTDWSWWPVPGMQRPPGVSYALTPTRLAVIRALSETLGARLIMGINFEADSQVIAASEARALIAGIGRGPIEALELGNEPELYHSFGWYVTPSGGEVPGRPAGWGFPMFNREFSAIASALPSVPLAGPTTGNPWWDSDLASFLADEPRVRIATVHRYPLWICSNPASPLYPTAAHLLSAEASAGLAAGVSQLVRVAHAHDVPLRVDEMNMTPCPRRAQELRGSFATALWALNVLFEMASVGVDGVNVQTTTATTRDLFTFKHTDGGVWRAAVTPEYYGLLMFAQAVPGGSRLVALSPPSPASIQAWASRSPDGAVRVVMINDALQPSVIALDAPGARTSAAVERLVGPSTPGGRGVTLAGQTFGAWTDTGLLAGRKKLGVVPARRHQYVLTLPAESAELLTLE